MTGVSARRDRDATVSHPGFGSLVNVSRGYVEPSCASNSDSSVLLLHLLVDLLDGLVLRRGGVSGNRTSVMPSNAVECQIWIVVRIRSGWVCRRRIRTQRLVYWKRRAPTKWGLCGLLNFALATTGEP